MYSVPTIASVYSSLYQYIITPETTISVHAVCARIHSCRPNDLEPWVSQTAKTRPIHPLRSTQRSVHRPQNERRKEKVFVDASEIRKKHQLRGYYSSLSHYVQKVLYIPGGYFGISEPSTEMFDFLLFGGD